MCLFSFTILLSSNYEQRFLSSLHGFEDALLSFSGDPRTKDILGLLGVKVITTTEPESSRLVMASHEPNLSTYDFQKLCSVLCAYRFFEIVSLRAQCIPRVPISTPTARMFLPGPPSSKDGLEVSVCFLLGLIIDDFPGIFPFARLAEHGINVQELCTKIGGRRLAVSRVFQSFVLLNAHGCQEQF